MSNPENMARAVARALLPIALSSICLGAVYAAVQHDYRASANDPQIQMAQDAAASIAVAKRDVATLRARYARVDISRSLAPWLAVYDSRRNVLESSATLDGSGPVPPAGVFDSALDAGVDQVTWQPQPGVRAAIVVRSTSDHGFVVAGRSLREVESREGDLTAMMLIAWLAAVVVSAGAAFMRWV